MRGCRPFTDNEVALIFTNGFTGRYEHRNRSLFALGVTGGFRISELLSLRVGDVWQHQMVTRHVLVKRQNVKRKSQGRSVKLTEEVRGSIREWIKDMNKFFEGVHAKTALFCSQEVYPESMSRGHADKILNDALSRVGIVEPNGILGTHSMRKTFAERRYDYYVEQYKSGMLTREPVLMLQRDLGHSNVDSTLKYISFKSEDVPEELNTLSLGGRR